MSRLPNILYLHSHDTGRHVQPMGAAVAMPRVQALAEEGAVSYTHLTLPTILRV